MNHLCGLPNLSLCNQGNGDNCKDDKNQNNTLPPTNCLSDDEREVLDAFRKRYETVLLASCNATDGQIIDDEDEKRKDSTNSILRQNQSLATPAYEISHDDLPGSGLRPLDDFTLYRYLLADRRGDGTFDADESHRRLLAALKFRKEWRCDAIVKNVNASSLLEAIASNGGDGTKMPQQLPSHIQKCMRLRVGIWAGTDRHHRPVVFERLGQFFGSGNVSAVTSWHWMDYYLYFLEMHFAQMRESARHSGKEVDRIVYFADFQGVVSSIFNRKIFKVIPLLKALVKSVECHYPEVVDHIVLFNVPRVASAAYHMVRAFLDPVTAAKIELFAGVPYDRFKELMSDDVIPVEYGGRNRIYYPQTASE